MNIFKRLYLGARFFYLSGICIFLFLLSYLVDPFFIPALVLLGLTYLLLVADIILLFSKPMVQAVRIVADVLSLNDNNEVSITIKNLSRYRLRIRIVDELPFQLNWRDFSVKMKIPALALEKLTYQVKPQTRGEYAFGQVNIFVASILGLAVKKENFNVPTSVAVYPSVIQMAREQRIAMHNPAFLNGNYRSVKFGQSYEFDQIRQYVPGDDTRNINWKATSAVNEVMINTYEDERSQQIYSVIDKSRSMKTPFGGLTLVDYAINSALAFSNIVIKKDDKAGLVLFSSHTGAFLKAEKGPRQLKKIMYALYREKYDYSEAGYESLYSSIRRNIPNRSLIFLYTNFDSLHTLERSLPALRLISRNHLLVVVFFENEELENFAMSEADSLLDIYQVTIARKLILEKQQILRELQRNGIQAIKCLPDKLSFATINKYLELKSRGMI